MAKTGIVLELQRDWARGETYDPVVHAAIDHGGAYGLGLIYAKAILGADAREG